MSTTNEELDKFLEERRFNPNSEEFKEVEFKIVLNGKRRTLNLVKCHLEFLTLHKDYLDLKIYSNGLEYQIEYDRMDTAPKVLNWVEHLVTKGGVTTEHIAAFLEVAKGLGVQSVDA